MKIIFSAILLFFWSSIGAQILPEQSGTWYNPDQDGHGFILQVIDESRTIGYWYTYDANGNQIWFLLDGVNETNPVNSKQIAFTAWQFDGMTWGEWNPADRNDYPLGTVLMEFTDCWDGVATWSLSDWGSGSTPITRLSFVWREACSDVSEFAGDYTLYLNDSDTAFDTGTEITMNRDGTFQTGGEDGCPQLWEFSDQRDSEVIPRLFLDREDSCGNEELSALYVGELNSVYEFCTSDGSCTTYRDVLTWDQVYGYEEPYGSAIMIPR